MTHPDTVPQRAGEDAGGRGGVRPTAADTIPGYSDFLSKLTEAMKHIPPPPVFAQSDFFPSDRAWSFQHGRVDYICAGPAFWAQAPEAAVQCDGNPFVLGGVQIVDIDDPRNGRMREQVMIALVETIDRVRGEAPPTPQPGDGA